MIQESLLELARTALRDAARAVLARATQRQVSIDDIGGIAKAAAVFVLEHAESDLLAHLEMTREELVDLAMIEVASFMN